MHNQTGTRPIGKCKGCPSNLKRECALFEHPYGQWAKGHCKGYMNEAMYEQYLADQAVIHQKKPREVRQEKAAGLKTVTHQDGILNPGNARW